MAKTNKSVLPRTLINSNCHLNFCLKDEKKEMNYPRTLQSRQSSLGPSAPKFMRFFCDRVFGTICAQDL